MKIAIVFASHRRAGKNKEIEDMITALSLPHSFDFIRLADINIKSCTSCYKCADEGKCIIDDNFTAVFKRLIIADCIFIISPVYAPIPSKLCALFERLTSLMFSTGSINSPANPLLGKKAAVFSYCSSGITDDSQIKLILQKFLMVGYSFHEVNFPYINRCAKPGDKYNNDIAAYVKDILLSL